ncbi:MAG TPA: LysM peptidoglycan-binding domain-containing protein [Prolixibacteraceae bacterium]|nr:LysM peptidoglycan-binding domain-containing protein [Prolixibacteraceae bacterium]
MKFFSVFWVLVFVFSASFCFAQKQVEISGQKFILYDVTKSESVFSICQKYKVSQDDLVKANPGISGVVKAGTTVKIPVAQVAQETKKADPERQPAVEEGQFYYHKVGVKQTIFTIARQYEITVNDIIRFNPEATKGISVGQILKIPVNIDKKAEEAQNQELDVSQYSVHPVVSGETLYSLEQRYGISHDEMMKYNPTLENGLKTGMKLKIPMKKVSQEPVPQVVPEEKNVTKYKVGQGETLFSLAARFGVDVDDIKNANPSLLSRSLEAGEIILIPRKGAENKSGQQEENLQTVSIPDTPGTKSDCNPASVKKQNYKVAFLLPFYLDGNENPASIDKNQVLSKINLEKQAAASVDTVVYAGVNIDSKALGFLEFYEGALLAVDSLQRTGMKVETYAFDVSNQKMVNALLQLDVMRDIDLIVGPVYPEFQETVASFAAKNRIPMISPLASNGNLEINNSWYFKVSPTRDYQIEQTATYVDKELGQKNYVLLQYDGNPNSADAQLAKLCKDKLSSRGASFHEYNLQQNGLNDINTVLSGTSENVFFIPTDNEAQVSLAITNLNTLAETSNVILVGSSMLTKLKSIQPENFHKVQLRYLSPYFVDYRKSLVKRVVAQFREVYAAEPSPFSFQGFDVTCYFLGALQRFGKDFRDCLPNYKAELTQMNFSFDKVAPMGGYVNKSLFVTSYERNFDILNLGSFVDGSFKSNK